MSQNYFYNEVRQGKWENVAKLFLKLYIFSEEWEIVGWEIVGDSWGNLERLEFIIGQYATYSKCKSDIND